MVYGINSWEQAVMHRSKTDWLRKMDNELEQQTQMLTRTNLHTHWN